jgi:TRAP-type mannitol/chloroaromatic compound transport system permease small subunit
MLGRILGIIDAISEWSGRLFSFLVIPIFIIIGFEVIARYVFNSPTVWASELALQIFGVYFVIGGAYTLLYNRHVRMDMLYSRLSVRQKAIMDLVTSLLFSFLLTGVLLWYGADYAFYSIAHQQTTGSIWNSPIWPSRFMFVIAVLLLLLQQIATFIRNVHLAVTRRGMQ